MRNNLITTYSSTDALLRFLNILDSSTTECSSVFPLTSKNTVNTVNGILMILELSIDTDRENEIFYVVSSMRDKPTNKRAGCR